MTGSVVERGRVRVAVLDDYQDAAPRSADWSLLDGRAEISFFSDHLDAHDDIVARLEPFDVIVAMRERTPFPRSLLAALPALRLLITTGPANASFDLVAAKEHGVTICGTGGLLHPTSELAWGLILAVARHIPAEDRAVRQGQWQRTLGAELGHRTLGLLGLGGLGQKMARVAHAFDMRVVAWSQNLTAERAEQVGVTRVDKDELFSGSDVVSVHLQLSDRTRGLVGAREFALMRPTAIFVNTSRGPIVDEAALVDALRDDRIAGAGLDVFDQEPLPADHPLVGLPNTVLTPHLGFVSAETYGIFYTHAVEDILGWLDGNPVRVIA
jgi:phosphoglycerate dehydrogenase-like enzyme